MKKIIACIIAVLLFSSVAYGASTLKSISVSPNVATLKVDGKIVNADNFIYNGTTYVPLRAISENLSCDVAWDQSTKTASISSSTLKEDLFTLYIMAEKVERAAELAIYSLYSVDSVNNVNPDSVLMVHENIEKARNAIIEESKKIKTESEVNTNFVIEIGNCMNTTYNNFGRYLDKSESKSASFDAEMKNYSKIINLKDQLKLLIQI